MLENIFYIFLIIINTISCLDLRLSLGQKLESNLYPVIINLNEPLIFEINKIDLFCAYDISGSMAISGRTENLKKALNLLVEALDSQDRLTLIPFDHNSETIFDLEYMTSSNKEKANSLIDKIKPRGGTDFRPPISQHLQPYGGLRRYRYHHAPVYQEGVPEAGVSLLDPLRGGADGLRPDRRRSEQDRGHRSAFDVRRILSLHRHFGQKGKERLCSGKSGRQDHAHVAVPFIHRLRRNCDSLRRPYGSKLRFGDSKVLRAFGQRHRSDHSCFGHQPAGAFHLHSRGETRRS